MLTDLLLAEYHLVLYADQEASVQIQYKNVENQHMLDGTTDLKSKQQAKTCMISTERLSMQKY
jgi:hypothetical protein